MRQHPHNMTAATWAAICVLVTEVVVAYRPAHDKLTRRLTGIAARFTIWAVTVNKAPLVASDIFTANAVRKYAAQHYSDGGSRTTMTAFLNRLALAASGKHLSRYPRRTTPDTSLYTPRQLANIRSWARSRPNNQRADAMLLIALIGGAGLRLTEAVTVRHGDLHVEPDAVAVTVTSGIRPRRVPLITDWAALAIDAHKPQPDEVFLFLPQVKHHSDRRDGARRLGVGSAAADNPNYSKLRDTWVVTMLDRLPISAAIHAAGYPSGSSLHSRYGRFTGAKTIDLITEHRTEMVETQR